MPDEIKEIQEALQNQVAEATKDLTTELKAHKGRIADLSEQLDNQKAANSEQKEAFQSSTERLVRLEDDLQKASDQLARFQSNNPENRKTIGDLLEAKADAVKGYAGGTVNLLEFNTKDITSADASAGSLIQPQRDLSPIMAPQERLWLRQLMQVLPTSTNAIEWVQEKTRTNNAAIQASEGATKAQSEMDFEPKSSTVKTIAHFTRQSRQVLQDIPQLQGIIEDMLRYGLNEVEEGQLLNGAGTGANMSGLMTEATAYATTNEVATDTKIDRLRWAILQSEDQLYPASGIAMFRKDWAEIEMTKTDDKAYLFANPVNSTAPRLWGLPVISAPSLAANSFLVGGFNTGATIYDREQTVVRVAEMDGTDFVQNMIKILVEKRVMLAIKRPASFIKGNFTFA